MFLLYTDFGYAGPYVGQMHTVLAQRAPNVPVIDLMHDAPAFSPDAAGRLLTALSPHIPAGSVCVAVIDPGVGSARRPVAVQAGDAWFVGPDNGLFDRLAHSYRKLHWFEIIWQPENLSASFHGRDLFAPVAAALALQQADAMLRPVEAPTARELRLAEIIYIDSYGNAMTGFDAARLDDQTRLGVNGQNLTRATTFAERPVGEPFWYANSLGLAEVAVNQGNAAQALGLAIGQAVSLSQTR